MTDQSDRLRQARTAAGFASVQDAVDRFGWTYSTYGGHENGSRGIRAQAAKSYARAFGVDESWIMFGTGQGPDGKSLTASDTPLRFHGHGFAESEVAALTPGHRIGKVQAGQIAQILSPDTTPSYFVTSYDRPDLNISSDDVLILDPRPEPKLGDIVIGSVIDTDTGHSVTFLRRYFPPHLVGYSRKPVEMLRSDDERTLILGVVIASVRMHKD